MSGGGRVDDSVHCRGGNDYGGECCSNGKMIVSTCVD